MRLLTRRPVLAFRLLHWPLLIGAFFFVVGLVASLLDARRTIFDALMAAPLLTTAFGASFALPVATVLYLGGLRGNAKASLEGSILVLRRAYGRRTRIDLSRVTRAFVETRASTKERVHLTLGRGFGERDVEIDAEPELARAIRERATGRLESGRIAGPSLLRALGVPLMGVQLAFILFAVGELALFKPGPPARERPAPDDVDRSIAAFFAAAEIALLVPALALRPGLCAVGRDGVRLGSRFIPFEHIARVSSTSVALEIETTDHDVVRLHGIGNGRMAAFEALVRAALDEHRAFRPIALPRFEGSGEAFRSKLQAFVRSGYREAACDEERIWTTWESPGARREERIGAALALICLRPDEARARIEVSAAATLEAPTRRALEAIARGEEEAAAIEAALRTTSRA